MIFAPFYLKLYVAYQQIEEGLAQRQSLEPSKQSKVCLEDRVFDAR